jgi:hypothetical protein
MLPKEQIFYFHLNDQVQFLISDKNNIIGIIEYFSKAFKKRL